MSAASEVSDHEISEGFWDPIRTQNLYKSDAEDVRAHVEQNDIILSRPQTLNVLTGFLTTLTQAN